MDPSAHALKRGALFWIFFGIVVPIFLFGTVRRSLPLYGDIDQQEEGVRVEAANQYLHGLKPYRDIYLLYGPGNEIIEPLLAFHLFGTRLSSPRRWLWFQDATGPMALYALGLVALETPACNSRACLHHFVSQSVLYFFPRRLGAGYDVFYFAGFPTQ